MTNFFESGLWFYFVAVLTFLAIAVGWYIERKHRLERERYEKCKAKLHKRARASFWYPTLRESLSAMHRDMLTTLSWRRRHGGNTEEVEYELKVLSSELDRLYKDEKANKQAIIERESGFEVTKSARA